MTNHTETQEGYGVLVTRRDGTKFIGRWCGELMHTESNAERALADFKSFESGENSSVVRIRATWEVIEGSVDGKAQSPVKS